MGVESLQTFIEENCKDACKPVDLIKIARGLALSQAGKKRGPNRLCLIVDAESCLDRLYGGFYSDWACGGQWNRMNQFLGTLIQACGSAHMELVMYFNGSIENQRAKEWFAEQMTTKRNASNVLKHINNKATPPPKVWWIPPVSLRSSLRMALRQYGVPVAVSLEDHHQEVIQYCRENQFHGIVADEVDYSVFDPPRYFSAQHLKLTYKGALETVEFVLDDVAKHLDLHPKRFSIVAALLGNHLLTEQDLEQFHCKVCSVTGGDELRKQKINTVIKNVVDFVRNLQSVDNLDTVGTEAFGAESDRIPKFKLSVHYYMNGNPDSFGRFRKEIKAHIRASNSSVSNQKQISQGNSKKDKDSKKQIGNENWDGTPDKAKEEIKAEVFADHQSGYASVDGDKVQDKAEDKIGEQLADGVKDIQLEKKEKDEKDKSEKKSKSGDKPYKLSQDAFKVAKDRHTKGLMHPWVYQILTHNEIKIDSCLEEENSRELPSAVELYRPVRQHVYAILFDYNKRVLVYKTAVKEGKEPIPEKPKVLVKEWYVPRGNPGTPRCEQVSAEEVDWLVPGLHRLWLGQENMDKNRRLRSFLSCLNSDVPLMLNTSYIPQHMIVLCAVLRYMVLFKDQRVLRKHELDAFLATAVSPLLCDVETMQEMKLPMLTSRGVQLGTLFMRGVEHAMFVNDGCGAPVPWGMCCPWLFFDGKLFHFKLLKANNNTPLIDICDGQVDQVMRVERMRQAILQGVPLDLVFAKPPLPPMQGHFGPPQHYRGPMNMRPGGDHRNMHGGDHRNMHAGRGNGRGRGIMGGGHGNVDSRGGQLQIAGVVVGNWGPNMQSSSGRPGGRGTHVSLPPQVTSVGPKRGGQRGVVSSPVARGRGYGRPAFNNTRGGGSGGPRGQNRGGPAFNNRSGRGDSHNSNYPGPNMMNHYQPPPNRGRMPHRGDYNRMTLAERTKSPGGGRGRGCTVETQQDGGSIVSVSQLIKNDIQFGGQNLSSPASSAAQQPTSQPPVPAHMQQPQQLPPQQQAPPPQQPPQHPPPPPPQHPPQHPQVSQMQQQGPSHLPPQSQQPMGGTPGTMQHQQQQMAGGHINMGHLQAQNIHSQGQMAPPQMGGLSQGHINMAMSQSHSHMAATAVGMNLGSQGQMPPVSLSGQPLLNGQGDFGTFQGMHHNDLIGQNDLGMMTSQNRDFNMMESRIGVFGESTE